ncbi:MAG TPA: methionyl-tRNA formyltransferase [Pyrinomonadaceae bacterium]|jgi:methionyl-tRNA formyltransferase|nr:methionyl-tRNA formyltransferase [Pyrinomonadaceae bacterium]
MKIIFMGTPESAVPTLRRCVEDGHEVVAVWTQPDRPAGRGNKLKMPPVKEYAAARGLAVHQPQKIKTEEALALFNSRPFDAAVVVAYGRILPPAFLRAPRLGCVNVHFSLLPKYRGAAPVNWAVVRGENETGVTTMLMDEGLDTGDVLLQRPTSIGEGETAPQLLERLSHAGAELLSETLAGFREIEPRAQSDEDATPAPILKREDGLIDWTLGARDVERRVRGFQPWPNAYTSYNGRRLVVWRAEVPKVEDEGAAGRTQVRPGVIMEARGDALTVSCGGSTALRLVEVQLEGKQRVRARDFINGMHVHAGEAFG